MSTVCYGDLEPLAIMGKAMGSICAFTSLFLLALPIGSFLAKFAKEYNLEVLLQSTVAAGRANEASHLNDLVNNEEQSFTKTRNIKSADGEEGATHLSEANLGINGNHCKIWNVLRMFREMEYQ